MHVLATNRTLTGAVSRRSPSADPDTRTVHVEVDLADPDRTIPVNTTGEVRIDVGDPRPATAIPLDSASITRLARPRVFVVEGGVAHKVTFLTLGERGGTLYLEPALEPGLQVVTEGRALLTEGDHVAAEARSRSPSPAARGDATGSKAP